MSTFDVIYLTFALLSWRFWFPALRRFCREIWQLGDPRHGVGAEYLLAHRSKPYPARPTRVTIRHPFEEEPTGTPPADGFARKAHLSRRDLSSKKRWEGGFGRRGL